VIKMLFIYNKFLDFAKETGIEMIDFRFTDILGLCHHMTIPLPALSAEGMKEGIGFDSSSIKGWSPVHKSDMLMVPDINLDLTNVYRDPFSSCPTLIVFCQIIDVAHQDIYERDPRSLAKRAEKYLASLPFTNQAYFGPELEFFIFDSVTFSSQSNGSNYEVDGLEMMHHNMDKNNLGYRPSYKGGYVPVNPIDGGHEIRTEICKILQETGIHVERHHHEVAACQHEIGIRFNTLTLMGDHIQLYKYIVKNVAYRYGKTATFMPKPMFEENGSGMHVHQSLWLDDTNLFAGNNYAGLSEIALYYIGGILAHARSLNALTNPTTNSYKRLVPGYEAPIICAYSHQNRSSACRIPFVNNQKARRIEIRFPDPASNGYLALSAMLMAGLDGIEKRIHPGDHTSLNLYEQKTNHQEMCSSLREAVCALEKDHDYLLKGDVFSKDFIENYIVLKKEEIMHYERRPHPIEFSMYYCL
jgi:glutamine synthetase